MNLCRTEYGVCVQLPSGEALPIRHIMGIGMNYAAHAHEQGKGVPERPVVFTKNPASACLNGDEIVIPKVCQDRPQTDFEAELGVILGTDPRGKFIKDIPLDEALSCVLGYVCANDVSARWWQKDGSGGQFNRGKSFDTFCPIGPAVTPAASVPDPQALRILTRVNGETMQDSTTADMIFSVATLIHELSKGTTLLPGTLIVTGTPSGVGFARKPPVFLAHGDVVEVEIESLGVLKNRVREE
jgi:2-keto-4-pentenoate hydratase/2-oxohepta-3-ene-1,7-dioic acid hydratase in catechol pathway